MYKVFLLIGLTLLLVIPSSAFWSHSPISDNTRLTYHQDKQWPLAMVFTSEALYPAVLYCPAGFNVTLKLLNLSDRQIVLESSQPELKQTFSPSDYRSMDFGQLSYGEHLFYIHMPLTKEERSMPNFVPTRITCKIIAQQWPGQEPIYRTTLIFSDKDTIYPESIWLPAGKISELYIGAAKNTVEMNLPVLNQMIKVKPGQTSMTEFIRPKIGHYDLLIKDQKKGSIIVH